LHVGGGFHPGSGGSLDVVEKDGLGNADIAAEKGEEAVDRGIHDWVERIGDRIEGVEHRIERGSDDWSDDPTVLLPPVGPRAHAVAHGVARKFAHGHVDAGFRRHAGFLPAGGLMHRAQLRFHPAQGIRRDQREEAEHEQRHDERAAGGLVRSAHRHRSMRWLRIITSS
jgi:hypothetical protein